jgi:serine/threonine protein kinase
MVNMRQIFISATTRDLGSFREAIAGVLLKRESFPVIQNFFPPDHRTVEEMLRDKISKCGSVICLVGRVYGAEPLKRAPDEPRRSYTQMEYEIAIKLGKPVFVFVATDDCKYDAVYDEPEELRALQREHLRRIVDTNRVRMAFHSVEHLTDQVRIMDLDTMAQGSTTLLVVLLFADLIDLDAARSQRGDAGLVRDVLQPFRRMIDEASSRWEGTLRAEPGGRYQLHFQTAEAAVNAALALHDKLRHYDWRGGAPELRIGIHVGQIIVFVVNEARNLQAGRAEDVCRRLTNLAQAGQTLLSRTAFEIACESVRRAPSSTGYGTDSADGDSGKLEWRSHGRYQLLSADEPQEVYEVGVTGVARFVAPAGSIDQQQKNLSWRPAVGQEVPGRQGWILDRKLGEGGFGEVWLARNVATTEHLVFKFCFDASRLSSLERELTLVRLLRDELGKRDDIARLVAVHLDDEPYYLESEYVDGGNLREWGEADGRLAALPVRERLRLVREIAVALAAAHSVGVIHKDLKPGNVFMRRDSDDRWHPVLADFGIGTLDDPRRMKGRSITVGVLTVSLPDPNATSGTPMYQPPEVAEFDTPTVQWDIFALGVVFYQMLMADFRQPPAHGWEGRVQAALRSSGAWSSSPSPVGERAQNQLAAKPATEPDPESTAEVAIRLLKGDIGACVQGEPAERLSSVAQLVERLDALEKRVAVERTRIRSGRARIRMRRLTVGLGVSIAALVVVGGLGAFAYREWGIADRALAEQKRATVRAESAEKIATDSVDQFFTAVSESELIKVSRTESLRKKFLTLSIKYLDELQQKAAEGPKIKARIAQAHFYVGRMHERLDKYDQAEIEYFAALKEQIALLEADPTNHALRRARGETGRRLGLTYFEQDLNRGKARDVVEQARDALLAVRIDKTDGFGSGVPELADPALEFELAKTYAALAYMDKKVAEGAVSIPGSIGRTLPAARDEYMVAKAVLDRLIPATKDDDPRRPGYGHQRAFIGMNVGNMDRDAGRASDAASSYHDAAAFWRSRLNVERKESDEPPPDEAEYFTYRNNLALALRNQVVLRTAEGRLVEAEKLGDECCEVGERLVANFGYDICREALARNLLARGVVRLSLRWRAARVGNRDEAALRLDEIKKDGEHALEIFTALSTENSKRSQYREGIGSCHLLLAAQFADSQAWAAESELEWAQKELGAALQIYKELNSTEQTNPDHQSRLATIWRMLGDAQAALAADARERGDARAAATREAEADTSFREARKVADALIKNHTHVIFASQAGQHFCHAAHFMNQARALKRGDKVVGPAERAQAAIESAERAIEVLSSALKSDPLDDRARLYRIYARQERALARARLGDVRGAIEDASHTLREATDRADSLKGETDTDRPVLLLYGLAAVYARVALAGRRREQGLSGSAKDADSYREEALKLLEAAEKQHLFSDQAPRHRLANDPDFEALRSLDRFQRIARGAGSEAPAH